MYLTALALKTIRRRPVPSLLTIAGVALSVALILACSILNTALKDSAERTVEELGTGKTSIWIQERTENSTSIGTRPEGFPQELAGTIGGMASAASVHPSLKVFTTASAAATAEEPREIFLYGVDFRADSVVRRYLLAEGGYPAGPGEVLIGERLGAALRLRPGMVLTIQSARGPLLLTVSGLLSGRRGAGALHNNSVAYADLATVQRAFGYQGKVSSLEIVAKKGCDPLALAARLAPLIPANARLATDPIAAAAGDSSSPLRISSFILALFSIFIAACIIYNTMASGVEGARREIGLLRLVGMTRQEIRRWIDFQSLFFAAAGSVLGLGLGIVLGQGLIRLAGLFFVQETVMAGNPSLMDIAVSAGLGFLVTLATTSFPAGKAAKASPLQAIRDAEAAPAGETRWTAGNTLGLILIVLGFTVTGCAARRNGLVYIRLAAPLPIFIGFCLLLNRFLPLVLRSLTSVYARFFGLAGELAVRSLILRLKRTVIAVGAITTAVAIFIGYWGLTMSFKRTIGDWFDKTRWADLLVFSASGVEMDAALVARIAELPFIRSLNPLRYRFIPYNHKSLSDRGFLFEGIDPVRFQRFTGLQIKEGHTEQAIRAIQTGRAILINDGLAERLELKAGDSIRLTTPGGPVKLAIAGTVADYSDFLHRMGKIVYGSYETLQKYWGAQGYTVIQAKLVPGYSPENAKEQLLAALAGEYPLKVLTHAEERADVTASIDRVFSIFYALNALIFLIVFMSIFNTLLINVLSQTQEFAILRAVGCLAREIRRLIVHEAAVLGAIGAFFAAAAGTWLATEMAAGARNLMKIGLQTVLPLAAAFVLGLLTVGVALIATTYPRRLISGLSVSRVLRRIGEM